MLACSLMPLYSIRLSSSSVCSCAGSRIYSRCGHSPSCGRTASRSRPDRSACAVGRTTGQLPLRRGAHGCSRNASAGRCRSSRAAAAPARRRPGRPAPRAGRWPARRAALRSRGRRRARTAFGAQRGGEDDLDLGGALLGAHQRVDPLASDHVEDSERGPAGSGVVGEVPRPDPVRYPHQPVRSRHAPHRLAGRIALQRRAFRRSTRSTDNSETCARRSRDPRCASLR